MITMSNLIRQGADNRIRRAAQMIMYMRRVHKDQMKDKLGVLAADWVGAKFNDRQHEQNG